MTRSTRSMKNCLRAPASILLALALAACPGPPRPDVEKRPNIVLISIDSLRADHLGCYGYARPTSPVIDGLAAAGALFEVVTSSSSWTLPAHAALFTALPDSVHGVDRGSRKLTAERRTLAEALQAAGYRTHGIWTGPLLDPRFGFGQGFDTYEAALLAADTSWDEAVELSHEVVTGPAVLDRVDAFFNDNAGDEPFFLFVHLWDVHYDYVPPPPNDTLFDADYSGDVDGRGLVDLVTGGLDGLEERDLRHLAALYDGEITWTDQQVGRILERLEETGAADTTVVAVTSDHGEELGEHGAFGHKKTLFDESTRIPLVLRYPDGIEAGTRIGAPVRIVDVTPTLLELAGGEPLPDVMGRSLLPLLAGGTDEVPPALSELLQDPSTGRTLRAVRTAEWKILVGPDNDKPQGLWDLVNDPAEKDDVFGTDEALTRDAVRTLRATLAELSALRELHEGGRPTSGTLDEDLRKQLESLGYLDGGETAEEGSTLRAVPNPIRVCDGSGLGETVLHWDAPGRKLYEVRVDAPDGKLFAAGGASGSARTGRWARHGMRFFLVDPENGDVVGRTAVYLTRSGCPDDGR